VLQGLDGANPRLLIDNGAASFQGRFEDSLGTVMVLASMPRKGDASGQSRQGKPVGESTMDIWQEEMVMVVT